MEDHCRPPTRLVFSKDGVTWARLGSIQDLYTLMRTAKNKGEKVRIVRGNTSTGIYKPPRTDFLVDISHIPDLTRVSVGNNGISIGGAVTITKFMKILDEHKDLSPSYEPLLKHLKRVCTLNLLFHQFELYFDMLFNHCTGFRMCCL